MADEVKITATPRKKPDWRKVRMRFYEEWIRRESEKLKNERS